METRAQLPGAAWPRQLRAGLWVLERSDGSCAAMLAGGSGHWWLHGGGALLGPFRTLALAYAAWRERGA